MDSGKFVNFEKLQEKIYHILGHEPNNISIYSPISNDELINLGIFTLRFVIRDKKLWYRALYLQSPHWKKYRKEKIKSVGYKCERCKMKGSKRYGLDVHHKTYRNIFHEKVTCRYDESGEKYFDTEVLCRRCHEKEHGKT